MTKKIIALTSVFFVFTSSAYGYIDPGTGSYLVQVLIAAFVGASLGVKVYWKKIRTLLKKWSEKNKENKNQGHE
ncbi:MAG: hypothetical protein NT166_30355 [Candidatus Aminicenantes bacterium]|nr:hypothetical protein [Candidatus Aminicenantes bacterium]